MEQCFNPYLPATEYVPDGEPHVFDGRLYVFGSHDESNGCVFCPQDYVCYSAPVDDLANWTNHGVIYTKTQDPLQDGRMVLYAPDVTQGADGRYYLYYVLDKVPFVSVAVCNTPAGKYQFYGHVRYSDGTLLGAKDGDIAQFDPAVLTENDKTYLYTGFCARGMIERIGAMVTVLASDMLTIVNEPVVIAPGVEYVDIQKSKYKAPLAANNKPCPYKLDNTKAWHSYKDHAFFEGPSIRKINDIYYFVYSSTVMHELCYATSKSPTKDFTYRGVIVSNCDMHINSYKDANLASALGANNHGGIACINDEHYIFYHRHTNNTWYSRQGCAEKIKIQKDGTICQVQITSSGLNKTALLADGTYGAYIACNLLVRGKNTPYVGDFALPYITQNGTQTFIANIQNGAIIGFKYFCKPAQQSVQKNFALATRGYIKGTFYVFTSLVDALGKVQKNAIGKINCEFSNFFEANSCKVTLPQKDFALYLLFEGNGNGQLLQISFD